MRDRGIILILLAGLAMAAGCIDHPSRMTDEEPVVERGNAPEGSADPAPVDAHGIASQTALTTRTGCRETQAQASADPGDFRGLPEGYEVLLDGLGQATLVFVHQDCDDGGTVWVFVLLEVPEPWRREDATHGGVVMTWSDDEACLTAYKRWGFSAEAHAMSATTTDLGAMVTARIEGEPDFLFMVDGAGDHGVLPFRSLRLIDVNDGSVGATFDRDRPPITGLRGAATASLLPEIGLNPAFEHKAGLGAVSLDVVDVSLDLIAMRA